MQPWHLLTLLLPYVYGGQESLASHPNLVWAGNLTLKLGTGCTAGLQTLFSELFPDNRPQAA